MIRKENYEMLKQLYGNVASWALWKRPDKNGSPKSNTSDMSVFNDSNLLNILNPKYVFVGLNASSTHGERKEKETTPWCDFHSNYAYQNDYKLRFALMDTKYWGAYITDLIKDYPEVDSGKVKSYLKKHPDIVKSNVDDFLYEISFLDKKPLLIAMGDTCYDFLKNYLQDRFTIAKIKHYSFTIGKEAYREEVLKVLDSYNGECLVDLRHGLEDK